ncbi:MAG: methyltransferase domain-containing protein [Chloroflexi bacterium]|nr:methyltransferase domain-containing protein [Chloroflexota bacterium]
MLSGFRVQHEQRLAELRVYDVEPLLDLSQPQRVLDLANGRLRPQYTLLRGAGHRVIGIDLVNRPSADWTDRSYRVARWLYRQRQPQSVRVRRDDLLVCGNVNTLPFGSGAFDLVTSIAAFEHFLDVPSVVVESARVLRSGGVAWVMIHAFTCPSGGHNVSLSQIPLRHIPAGIDPWDHLRQRALPFHVPLNEWRIQQYVDEFAKHFEIVKQYCALREGEDLLTPAIERELAAYSRDELTCSAYVIVARKRS